jgi:hypothetical protein
MPGSPAHWTGLHFLLRPIRRLVAPERAVRRRVNAFVPVAPADSVSRVRVVANNLLDYPPARSAIGRLRLGEDVISA